MLAQVQFTPDGQFLLTGARQDPHLLCWDVRIQAGTTGDYSRLWKCHNVWTTMYGLVVCIRLAQSVITVGSGDGKWWIV